MDEGTRELRTSRPYLQGRSLGRAGRSAGGALPGPRPGSRSPAAHGPGRVRVPSGWEPAAAAAASPSLVRNLKGLCAPHRPRASRARFSRRPSPARSESSPTPHAPRPAPLHSRPPARAARASLAPPPAEPRPRPLSAAPPAFRGALAAPEAGAYLLRLAAAAAAAAGRPSPGAKRSSFPILGGSL